jgi:hypothetical protein
MADGGDKRQVSKWQSNQLKKPKKKSTKMQSGGAEKIYNPVVMLTRLEDEEKLPSFKIPTNENVQEEENSTEEIQQEEEDVIRNCTICDNQFLQEHEQIMDGLSEEDWKPLVFKTLCNHLNVPHIFESFAEQINLLEDSMRELKFCPECLIYSWRLLGMDQDLIKLLSEINVLTNSFRDIITVSFNNGSSAASQNIGDQENIDGQSVMHNFKTSVAAQS